MNDRTFRLDFFIAISAVLISALTAGTLFYQTRVIGDQFAATIWPYLSVEATYDNDGEMISVVNDGVGPALIRSAQLQVDGRPVRAWNDYEQVLANDPATRTVWRRTLAIALGRSNTHPTISASSIGPSSTLRPGEARTLFRVVFVSNVPSQVLTKHTLALDICYCSLNGSCWSLHAMPGRINPDPQSISHCVAGAAIQSHPPGASLLAPVAR
jgi:hypothetical protein